VSGTDWPDTGQVTPTGGGQFDPLELELLVPLLPLALPLPLPPAEPLVVPELEPLAPPLPLDAPLDPDRCRPLVLGVEYGSFVDGQPTSAGITPRHSQPLRTLTV
jgi:hypothetical protein